MSSKSLAFLLLFVYCSAYAKRLAPNRLKAVINAGIRYEVPHWASENNKMKHNGGYIQVVNNRNNSPICIKEVYEVKYDDKFESDIQDNFIIRIYVKDKNLIIESEGLKPISKPFENFCD